MSLDGIIKCDVRLVKDCLKEAYTNSTSVKAGGWLHYGVDRHTCPQCATLCEKEPTVMSQQPMSVWKFFGGVGAFGLAIITLLYPIAVQYVLQFGPDWLVAHKSNELPPLGFSASAFLGFVALVVLSIISIVKWADLK